MIGTLNKALSANSTSKERLVWIDVAKLYGIFLVFYSHFLDDLYFRGNEQVFYHCKFIHSFHMPLFFIMSGFFTKVPSAGFDSFLKKQISRRLRPVLFFGAMTLPFWVMQNLMKTGGISLDLIRRIVSYALGRPHLNFITWFLVCLFVVELINYFVLPHLKTQTKLVTGILIFYVVGWLVTWQSITIADQLGIPNNIWFIPEAIIAYSFYLFGHLLARSGWLGEKSGSKVMNVLLFVIMLVVTAFTFDLNQGPFWEAFPIVNMAESWHGNIILFPLTALSGSFLMFSLSRLTPAHPFVRYAGKNTLILLGLNGFFEHFFNRAIPDLVANETNAIAIAAYAAVVSLTSMLVCLPFIPLFNKFVPQLVGK